MNIKELNIEEINLVYNTRMIKDFPKSELKPLKDIHRMLQEYNYKCLGFYDNNELCAYAFLCFNKDLKYVLIDYLAVIHDKRGQGIGRKFLSGLAKLDIAKKGYMIEVERVCSAKDEEEAKIRERRILFYKNSGVDETLIESFVFDADYSLMFLPNSNELYNTEGLFYEYKELYKIIINNKELYNKYFKAVMKTPICIAGTREYVKHTFL